MSACTDPGLGHLLAEYELGLLSGEARERFELHAMGCDHCFAELDRLAQVSERLRGSERAWTLVRESAAESPGVAWYVSVGRWLWPQGGPWLKPALSLAAVALVVIWQGWTSDVPTLGPVSSARPVHELPLQRLRGETTLPRAGTPAGVDLVVVFGAELGSPARPVEVTALGPRADTLFHSHDFRLDANLQGRLNLGPGPHLPGLYILIVHDPGAPAPFRVDSLRFEVVSLQTQTQ